MCVILVVGKDADDITEKEFRQAFSSNRDGYGVAWLNKGKVQFRKTLKPGDHDRKWRPPKPYVMHFRWSTVGGDVTSLCHPFEVSTRSRPKSKGKCNKVLFHNGHVVRWEELALASYSDVGRLPKGPWSDSRAVAMMLGRYGNNVLGLPAIIEGQKYAVFDGTAIKLFGKGWIKGKKDNIYRSNENHLKWIGGYSSSSCSASTSFDAWDDEDWEEYYDRRAKKAVYKQKKKTSTYHASTYYGTGKVQCPSCGSEFARTSKTWYNVCPKCAALREHGCVAMEGGGRCDKPVYDKMQKTWILGLCFGHGSDVKEWWLKCKHCSTHLEMGADMLLGECAECREKKVTPCPVCMKQLYGIDIKRGIHWECKELDAEAHRIYLKRSIYQSRVCPICRTTRLLVSDSKERGYCAACADKVDEMKLKKPDGMNAAAFTHWCNIAHRLLYLGEEKQ